jgi:ubiquinone/menaquinone biosynthesis C-methylase UbiE
MGNVRSWAEMAAWFDARQGDDGDRWHRELIYPCVKKMAGNVAGLRALDLACGNGSLTRWLKREGASVTGTDGTLAMIECARRRESAARLGIEYIHCDAAKLAFARANEFDLVMCTMALMDMPDDQAAAAIHEIARVMKADGRAIICISHPCFDAPENSEWVIEQAEAGDPPKVWRKVRRYREQFSGAIAWSQREFFSRSYHRPLEWYFRRFRDARLGATAFEEPHPSEKMMREDEDGKLVAEAPVQCVMELRKFPDSRH